MRWLIPPLLAHLHVYKCANFSDGKHFSQSSTLDARIAYMYLKVGFPEYLEIDIILHGYAHISRLKLYLVCW